MPIPTIIKRDPKGERMAYDIFSMLLTERILFVTGEVESDMANIIIAQLLHLEHEDKAKDITMYVNSPGGDISSGMAIIDTMNHIKPDVVTISVGMSASMGSLILTSGAKGKRYALPSASILIHQPLSSGISGQVTDIEITTKRLLKLKEDTINLLVKQTGQTKKRVIADIERDYWMDPEEAKEYGLIDHILTS